MSFHAGQTFTFGEQPSATKWQYLWDNDYALADGTGISNNAILTRHLSNGQVTPSKLDLDPATASVAAGESTSSTSFTDLATVGPSVDVTIGANGLLLVLWRAQFSSGPGNMNVSLSGANTYTGDQTDAVYSNNLNSVMSGFKLFTGLSTGVTTVRAKYKSDSGASSFLRRWIFAVPL